VSVAELVAAVAGGDGSGRDRLQRALAGRADGDHARRADGVSGLG
jgi:hypothetical protein